MDCEHPQLIKLPDGRPQVVRCGRCLRCLSHRQAEWTTRLRQEMEFNPDSSYFVTLTYDEEHLPKNESGVPSVRKADPQKLHMDLRRRFQQGFYMDKTLCQMGLDPVRMPLPLGVRFRFYLTSEYGPQGHRPHYHAIYFGLPSDPDLVYDLFNAVWQKGFLTCEPARTEAFASYVAKYLVNESLVQHPDGAEKPFALMSQGIGKSYLDRTKLVDWHRSDPVGRNYVPYKGGRQILPRYLREKIFDDSMKADILEASLDREQAEFEAESRLSVACFGLKYEALRHRHSEARLQAEWRFKKNGKIK